MQSSRACINLQNARSSPKLNRQIGHVGNSNRSAFIQAHRHPLHNSCGHPKATPPTSGSCSKQIGHCEFASPSATYAVPTASSLPLMLRSTEELSLELPLPDLDRRKLGRHDGK